MTNPNRALIIDDEADIRAFFREVAEEAGFRGAEAGGGLDFSQIYDAFDPTVIVLDLTMPEVDGVEFLRELSKRNCMAPIILASGKDERVMSTAQRLGRMLGLNMHASLQKPVELHDLLALFNDLKVTADGAETSWRPSPQVLENAINDEELSVHFQPKVALQREGFPVVGLESLARWRHPIRGFVPPDDFLPVAEEYDLIGPLTEVVLKYAVSQLKKWRDAGVAVPVSVNLSPRQLTDLTLPDRISKLLADASLDPSLLVVEVTEQAAMADLGAATDILTRLRLKEIAVSLDDFGAGYSSLIEVYRLPLTELKLDRSLIADIERDEDARTVVKAIAAMARELKLEICVEGVETLRAAKILQSFGCSMAQGFYFGKPVCAAEITKPLQERAMSLDRSFIEGGNLARLFP